MGIIASKSTANYETPSVCYVCTDGCVRVCVCVCVRERERERERCRCFATDASHDGSLRTRAMYTVRRTEAAVRERWAPLQTCDCELE